MSALPNVWNPRMRGNVRLMIQYCLAPMDSFNTAFSCLQLSGGGALSWAEIHQDGCPSFHIVHTFASCALLGGTGDQIASVSKDCDAPKSRHCACRSGI